MWFHTEEAVLPPDYTDLNAPPATSPGGLTVFASGAPGVDGLIRIRQDAIVSGGELQRGGSILSTPERRAYVFAVDGPLAINDAGLPARGGAEISGVSAIRIVAQDTPSRVLVIDVAEKFSALAA